MPLTRGGRANSPAAVAARRVRLELRTAGMPHADHLDDITIYKVCRKISTDAPSVGPMMVAGLVADALVKCPRPGWLERMVGPYPFFFENVHPADIADPKEWGGLGSGT